jgi:hemoglobin
MKEPRDVYVPDIDPGRIVGPSPAIYAAMGRDHVYRMVADLYREIAASPIRSMFPSNPVAASRKSAAFFVQLLGEPPEYSELRGPPRMRARHLAFPITRSARDAWLSCFERVLDHAIEDYAFPAEHLEGFREFLRQFSLWMVNTAEANDS